MKRNITVQKGQRIKEMQEVFELEKKVYKMIQELKEKRCLNE